MALAVALHALAAVIWVGGMFFAYLALRPAAAMLEPPQRLALWQATLARFFRWVWAAVAVLLLSGYWLIGQLGGMAGVGLHVHIMHALGLLMMALYAHLFFVPFRRLGRALAAADTAAGARALNGIRVIVAVNLSLGLLVVALGAGGRYLTF